MVLWVEIRLLGGVPIVQTVSELDETPTNIQPVKVGITGRNAIGKSMGASLYITSTRNPRFFVQQREGNVGSIPLAGLALCCRLSAKYDLGYSCKRQCR